MLYEIEIIKGAIHGAVIKRGYLRQHVVADKLRESGRFDEVKEEEKVSVEGFKSGKHKVDIYCKSNERKEIILINSKSNGISHTDAPTHTVKTYLEAIKGVKKLYPQYTVEYIVLRPSGEEIPEWKEAGIKTFKTAEYLEMTENEFDNIYKKEYEEKMKENLMAKLREQDEYLSEDRIKELYEYCLPLIKDIHE